MNGTDVEEPLQGMPEVEMPEGPQEPVSAGEGQGANVRLMYYGENFGEHNRDANYGPDGTKLEDHHVAISPSTAEQLGLKLGDWVWVGPQLRQYMDSSYVRPGEPTHNTVEVRDYPADGHTTLRKASPEDVQNFAPASSFREPLSAMQASYMTGKSTQDVSSADLNQFLENVPQRALAAGDVPAAAYEYAQQQGAGEQAPEWTQPADVPNAMDQMSSDFSSGAADYGAGVGTGDVVSGDFATPDTRHSKVQVMKDGTRVFDDGAVKYHPNTDTLEWTIGGRTFLKTGEYGKVTSFPSSKIWRNPDDGQIYNVATGTPVPIKLPGQSPAYDPNLSAEKNLSRLSPQDEATVQMYANYQLPLTTRFGRLNPEYARLRAYVAAVNPDIDPRNYQLRQQTMLQMASGQNGSLGQRLNSWNQALIHSGNVWDLASKLPEGNIVKANELINYIRTNFGNGAAANFEAQNHLFATEVERAISGGVPSVTAVQELENRINASRSKAQIESILKDVMAKTIEGGLEDIDYGYNRNMGKHYPNLIADEAAQSLGKMGITTFAHRDLSDQQKNMGAQGAQSAAEQAAIAELTRQKKLINPDTIKQTMKIMQGQQ